MSNIIVKSLLTTATAAHPTNRTVGAVVIGGDYQGLGIVRSLGRHGIPVCVIDDEHSISRFSRYSKYSINLPNLREERTVVDALLNIGKRFDLQGWLLYPTREELVSAVSRNRTVLSELFRVPTPEWETVQWACDKRNTYLLANELGIPTPITHYPQTTKQLNQLARHSPPFAIKPAIKEHFIYSTKAKAWRADTHAELEHLFEKASQLIGSSEVMVQELIPGGGNQQYSYCAFFRDGRSVGHVTVRRRRQHPVEFGRASTYVETVEIPILQELSERFLRAIGYYGLVEVEYKLDPRDGQYKLLDVNPRTWGYHSIGLAADVDFSYMLYADQVGLPVHKCQGAPGIGWVRVTTDLPAAFLAWMAGDLDFRGYVRSLRNCKTEAVFSLDDPLPGLVEILLLPYLALKRGF